MRGQQTQEVERKIIAILKVLNDSPRPLGGRVLARHLGDLGINLGERAVRYHLKLMDERGLTHHEGLKDGRSITKSGIEELDSALISDRVGRVAARIGELAYQSSFDPERRTGEVPVNVSLIPRQKLSRAIAVIKDILPAGLGASDLAAVAAEGEQLGEVIVPPGKAGLATVSHVVVYGALLRAGILVDSRFGGLLQIRNHEYLRFVDLIEYSGCSLDPAEVFIAGKMTSVGEAAKQGNGKILASAWEIPAIARPNAEAVIGDLEAAGIKAPVLLGRRGEAVYQLPVAANSVGMVLADGLNPVAAVVEAGIEVVNYPMSGSIDFEKLRSFRDL